MVTARRGGERVAGWRRWLSLWLLLCLAPACSEEGDPSAPYVEFTGGGFIFNYRLAEAYYGFVVKVLRPIPAGTLLQARFENPSGAEPLLVERIARPGMVSVSFETPPLQGVQANRDYQVELRLIEPESGVLLAEYRKAFQSTLDQDVLPKQPLTIGPGYQRNPEAPSPPASR
jgi:hypothetical protein